MIRRTKFYLNKRQGKLMGVCAGLGDYFGVDALWVRIVAVVLFVSGVASGFVFLAYLLVGFLASDRPRELDYDTPEEQAFWRDVRTAPTRTIGNVRSNFRDLDRRLRDIEAYYTNGNRRLAQEIDNLK